MSYHRPADLGEALSVLSEGAQCIAAGCTDLYPATPAKALPGPVLDITAIEALRGIARTAEGWRLGATTTWTDILDSSLPPAFDSLKFAAREIGSVQIQNAGTVAGNLCTASPAADSVPCLLTLDAEVELQSAAGIRTLPLAKFITRPRQTARRPDELITAVLVPETAAQGTSHFLKLGARKYLIISIVMSAARLVIEDGCITEAALAIGACSPVATRLPEQEAALIGHQLSNAAHRVDEALVAPRLSPIDDIRADTAFRRHAATELLRRTLAELSTPAEAAA
ncbi:MAG: FAD binding domain-containing protein [Rhodobacter sp.]|nr:FAD binding domain-containing protein [Rhodobacter sp.]